MPYQGGLIVGDRRSVVTGSGGLVTAAGALTKVITLQPAIEATPDYDAGDVIGGLQTLLGAARVPGGTGKLVSVSILSKVDIAVATRLIIFKSNPSATTFTENSALSVNAADVDKILHSIEIASGDFADMGTPEVAVKSMRLPFKCADGIASLFAVFQAAGTINFGSTSDLTFNYGIEQD